MDDTEHCVEVILILGLTLAVPAIIGIFQAIGS
jgi:hypothetical protein